MKKIFLIAAMVVAVLFAGCGNAANTAPADTVPAEDAQTVEQTAGQKEGSFSIIATIFPEYDWVKEVLKDNPAGAELTLLLKSGIDLHNYQPTAEDIMKISDCDLFIYAGGESDEWVEDVLKQSTNPDMVVINLLDILGSQAKEEELKEGMQAEAEEEGGEEGPEYDEHVWLSLKNAKLFCGAIEEALAKIDPDNAEIYKKNAEAYNSKLDALDQQYEETVSAAPVKTLLFGDRFPFRYLTDDYGLDYYAAFVGCSAETEASFETILFLSEKVNELGLKSVMTIEGDDHSIAETIIQNTETKDQTIRSMNSMQSVTSADVENGVTYLSLMEENLNVLAEALK